MKKKFIAVYALIGVLALGSTTLTSCVDDNESPSVTAIRDAKAQSLQALANLTQAQADAEKIVSEAEARLTAAKAALKEAEAQLAQQKADSVKAVMDISIESAKQAAQAELYKQQGIVAEAQAQLIASLDAVDQATKQKIETLLANADALMNGGEYLTYQLVKDDPATPENESGWQWKSETIDKSITDLQLEKVSIKAEQVKAEYGLADVKEAIADEIEKQDEIIAQNKALIESYTALKGTSTREEVEKQYKEAQTNATATEKDLNEKTQLANVKKSEYLAYYDFMSSTGSLLNTTLLQAMNANSVDNPVLYDKYNVTYYDPNNPLVLNDNGTPGDPSDDYWTGDNPVTIQISDYLNSEILEDKIYEYENADKTYGSFELAYGLGYGKNVLNWTEVDTDLIAKNKDNISRDIEIEKALIEKGKKDLEDYKKSLETDIKTAQDALKTAQDAWNKDKTEANKVALENAENQIEYYEYLIENYEQGHVTLPEENLEKMEAALEVLGNIETLLTGTDSALATYQAMFKEYMTAQEAWAEAYVEQKKAQHADNVADALVATLKPYVDNAPSTDLLPDWDALIEECNDAIASAEIDKATATGQSDKLKDTTLENKDVTEEVMNWYIEKLAQDLAAVEAQLNYYNSLYKSCMDQANELIQNGAALPDTPSTDTPAEGEGEETPAE